MKTSLKSLLSAAVIAAISMSMSSCSDDNGGDDNDDAELQAINVKFVDETVVPTYEGLCTATKSLIGDIQSKNISKACTDWKSARQYWEWSESFLFGAASGYGIDPHIDTWPFDAQAFNNYMSRYPDLATDEAAQAIMSEAIATGQSLTGFHAIEYLLFRDGQPRTSLTDNEWWFCEEASNDLYLAATKLAAAWGGDLTSEQESLLEDAEFEYDDFGDEFKTNNSRRWNTALSSNIQIIEGALDIIDEVAHSKIGNPNTGADVDYIESPHAWNSIQDFYDNIQSCKHSLYGFGPSESNNTTTTPASGSLMAYSLKAYPTEAAKVATTLETALTTIKAMKAPFVKYYADSSAAAATAALEELADALEALEDAMN